MARTAGTRLADTILSTNEGWAAGRQNPLVDLRNGAQLGYAPDLTRYISNQSYIRKNLICLLVEPPRGFAMLGQNADLWNSTLRALVELHPLSIDGFAAGLEVDVQETAPVGGGGEQHQDFVNVTRARSEPTFRWTEKYGRPIEAFFRNWIQYLMMDPDTKVASIATLDGITTPTDMLADIYSMTCAFIEPDPTHTKVVKSWLCTNMFPHSSGEVTGRRELTAAGEAVTYDIKFSAISQYGLGVDQFCQGLMDSMNLANANPFLREAFVDGLAATMKDDPSYAQGITNMGATALQV
jgi:hypothetical protein